MGKKNIAKNYVYNLMYQILVLILPLITTPYVSRVLGVENIGIFSYTTSISAFFILFGSLGTALYGQREIAFSQDDKAEYTKKFWEIITLRICTIGISLVFFYFSFANNVDYGIYYKILILEIIGNCVDISWFFQGLEEFKKTVIRNMIIRLVSVGCIFIFVKSSNDLFIYFYIYIISLLLGNLSLWLYLPKFLIKVKLKEIHAFRHLKPTIVLFIPQIAIQVYTILDKAMIGSMITEKSEVGFYEQSQKIIRVILTIEGAFGTVMMPRVANNFAMNDNQKIKEDLYKSFSMAYILAFPMIIGIFVVSDYFVPLYFGAGYEKVSLLMKVISPIILFIGISGCIGHQYLLPTKRQKEYTISVVLGAIVNMAVNSILIFKYRAVGAAIGTVIAEFSVALCQIVFIRKDFRLVNIMKISINYIIASIIMLMVCIAINSLAQKATIALLLDIMVGAVTYVTVLIALKDQFFMQVANKVLRKLKKN